jgi:hypothetical protein
VPGLEALLHDSLEEAAEDLKAKERSLIRVSEE